MKYIVFSFDDGLIDFKTNALEILNHYNAKATINVISGFSDLSIQTNYKYLSVEDIKSLYEQGFEIANHTDLHIKHGSYEELMTCNNKINIWCGTSRILGIVMPKYAKPNDSATTFIKDYKPPYVTYERQKIVSLNNFIKRFWWKIKSIISKTDLNLLTYSIQRKAYRKGRDKNFKRFEVGFDIEPESLYKSLKTIPNGFCVTLCFHSVVNDVDSTPYPKGSCTIQQFENICKLICRDKELQVVTQIEACKK